MNPIRVMIADDHPVVVEGVRRHLARQSGLAWRGSAASVPEALAALERETADVLVLDVQIPGMEGAATVERFLSHEVKVILFTLREEDDLVASLVAAGAQGFVSKSDPLGALVAAIETVGAGGSCVSETLRAIVSSGVDAPHQRLTEREHEVFLLLARCLSPKEVAFEMGVSASTAYTHVERVRSKLEAGSLAEVVQYAKRWNLA